MKADQLYNGQDIIVYDGGRRVRARVVSILLPQKQVIVNTHEEFSRQLSVHFKQCYLAPPERRTLFIPEEPSGIIRIDKIFLRHVEANIFCKHQKDPHKWRIREFKEVKNA